MRLIENFSVIRLDNFLEKESQWDILITCVNSEARCLRSCDIFLNNNTQIDTSIIFDYLEENPQINKIKNLDQVRDKLKSISNVVKHFGAESVSMPSEGIKKFLSFIETEKIDFYNKNVIFDITVLSTPYFFLLFKVMLEKFGLIKFHVIYTEPLSYRPKDNERDEIVLTEGLIGVKAIPGFVGSIANSDDALIIILGFEGKRSVEVFNSINPKLSYAINGFPSFKAGWHKISIESNLRFLKESGAYEHQFNAPASDPFRTQKKINEIVKIIKKNDPNLDIVIAPLGSKMQAFGALLHAFINKDIRVIYPFPSSYHPKYSNEYGPTWIFKVDIKKLLSVE